MTTSQPSETALREAALRHLARYTATSVQLLRVLDRRVDRWLRAARTADEHARDWEAAARKARRASRRVVAALVASRVVDDAAYAGARAASLLRSGRSRAKVAQHLGQRGIDAETRRAVLAADDDARELAAALLLTCKRRLGAFAPNMPAADDALVRQRALGILARAGFSHGVARIALATGRAEAEQRIEALRRQTSV